jgi:D-xylonolactonase
MSSPECIWNAHAQLGEGPLWSVREQALYWVDILGHRLHRYSHKDGERTWQFGQEVSAVAERAAREDLIITQRHSIASFNPVTEELTTLLQLETEVPDNRLNDGKCDPIGRFWAGTMDFAGKAPTGSLYRIDPGLDCAKVDSGYAVSNGPAWSSDYRTMYHNASADGCVYAFDFNLGSGEATNRRLFLQFGEKDGSPDGMTTDAEGGLWIAHWGAGKFTRHDTDADGRVTHTIELPCSQVSSCTFGGRDLTTLYMTTACTGLSAQQLRDEPLAGGLFAVDLDIVGVPANLFRGSEENRS